VFVGCDRVAANGDTANKIGTYGLALAAAAHDIPFYVCAPFSTVDTATPDGSMIVIEERDALEVTGLWYAANVAPEGVKVYNPAFDVTPARYITAFITERGIIRPPYDFSAQIG
jgi:methylthioribose-1-phosphate isomerase